LAKANFNLWEVVTAEVLEISVITLAADDSKNVSVTIPKCGKWKVLWRANVKRSTANIERFI